MVVTVGTEVTSAFVTSKKMTARLEWQHPMESGWGESDVMCVFCCLEAAAYLRASADLLECLKQYRGCICRVVYLWEGAEGTCKQAAL